MRRHSDSLSWKAVCRGALLLILSLNLACAEDEAVPKLTDVSVKNRSDSSFGIGDTLELKISNLSKWRKAQATDKRALVLYVDGVPFAKAELPRADDDHAEFHLDRISTDGVNKTDEASRQSWNRLLARPTDFMRTVTISVGPREAPPWASGDSDATEPGFQPPTLRLIVLWKWGFWCYAISVLGLAWAIVQLAKKSNILRDGASDDPSQKGTFSLARCQMAFWFVAVLGAYLFIWLSTGAIDNLSASALGLLGISGGTGLISTLIDRSKKASAEIAVKSAEEQRAKVARDIATSGGIADPAQSQMIDSADKASRQAKERLRRSSSEGFFKDILADENGITMHRLQVVVWNMVLGVIFLFSVYQGLSMPEPCWV